MYEALGQGEEEVKQRLKMLPAEDGIVVGDETRLRQIITNLARFVLSPRALLNALRLMRLVADCRAFLATRASSPPRVAS